MIKGKPKRILVKANIMKREISYNYKSPVKKNAELSKSIIIIVI